MVGNLGSILSVAASGLNAASAQLNATANNIANLDTPKYQAQRVDLVELSTGGVAVGGITRDTTPRTPGLDGQSGSNVDLAHEAVDLIREKALYSANAAVIRTADQMYGSLLDILDHPHHDDSTHR